MIIPCIDLMKGKVVQLVQGREKVFEAKSLEETLARFAGFRQIQVIDLDAAMGTGSNDALVAHLAERATLRAGGGVRSVARAQQLLAQGAFRVIVGTSAFSAAGPNHSFLKSLDQTIGRERLTIALDSKAGRIVTNGWQKSTPWTAVDMIVELEPYCSGFLCTYVDKEGMLSGTDIAWFEALRRTTQHEIVAAGGITTLDEIKALTSLDIHCAIGMAIYTGRLQLEELRAIM